MLRVVLLLALVIPAQSFAQSAAGHHPGRAHVIPASRPDSLEPKEPGQAAFAAIQEIVGLLEANPRTDWSKVNLVVLREHLIDMDNVTLRAEAKAEPVDDGVRFIVSGVGPVKDSIRRMVMAHAATMNAVGGWTFSATETEDGANLTVRVPAKDRAKLSGLGFIGVMTRGMHHQAHHLMIAQGGHPH